MTSSLRKSIPLKDICEHTQGRLQGNPALEISGVCALDEQTPGSISFVKANSDSIFSDHANLKAAAFFVPLNFEAKTTGSSLNLIFVADPFAALVNVIPFFREIIRPAEGVSPKADVHPTAKLGQNVSVGAFAVLSARVEIGDNTIIHPNVTIYPDVKIGANCIVHSGTVIRETCHIGNSSTISAGAIIGSEGFGYVPDKEIGLRAIPQIGGVRLADRVDVGANACIDRATLGNTSVGLGSKIDNLVQVGHNVKLGAHCILCGQVGIAGSTNVGDRCTFAGSSGVGDHLTIVSDVRLAAKGGAVTNLLEKGDYAGYPAIEGALWHRQRIAIQKLPELMKRVRALEKEKEGK